MKVVILQSNYVPWKGYFNLIEDADVFVFYDEVQYTKNDWRNRNQIYTKNGLQWITIPVHRISSTIKISDVKIDSAWCNAHYKALYLGYKAAPYFNQLKELMDDYLIEREWETLKQLNQYLIKEISRKIGISTKFIDSATLMLDGNRVERIIGVLKQLGASHYITGPGAESYLNESRSLFSENQIELIIKKYPEYKEYKQLREPFKQQVSILDLIANLNYAEIMNYIR